MKDFKHFGVKRRVSPEHNYNAIWYNLKTTRFGKGVAKELPPQFSEFYDVSLGNKCNAGCPWCYVSATSEGTCYEGICETWEKWMSRYNDTCDKHGIVITNKPFQIAIGSEGEPTIHPEFCRFIETVYNTNVVPNYTTNGIVLSYWDQPGTEYYEKALEILDVTRKYCGGVAVSFGNKSLRKYAKKAVEGLLAKGEAKINLHHIISTRESVDEFVEIWREYGDAIAYHVLLPLMPSGRSKKGIEEGVFEYLEEQVEKHDIKNIAFGAHFIKYLENSKIKTWLYPAESMSKNVILTKDKVQITPSSFDLNPIMTIEV